jgi:hypothetical protein
MRGTEPSTTVGWQAVVNVLIYHRALMDCRDVVVVDVLEMVIQRRISFVIHLHFICRINGPELL